MGIVQVAVLMMLEKGGCVLFLEWGEVYDIVLNGSTISSGKCIRILLCHSRRFITVFNLLCSVGD